MRCQKCGFISFDQPSCSKCGANQTGKTSYTGTGQITEPPFFLAAALGDAVAETPPAAAVTEAVVEEAQDGSTALFDALEAESQGILIAEEPPEIDLSFDQPEEEGPADEEEEEISLEIPGEEVPTPAVEEPKAQAEAPAAADEELIELSLASPDSEEAEEVASVREEEESLEITLEIPDESPASLDLVEPEPEADTRQDPEDIDTTPSDTSTLDLEEIDLSDLVADSRPASTQASDNDEIFDLSSLMGGDEEEDQPGDEFTLTMDVTDTPAADTVKSVAGKEKKKDATLSGLTLESEE